MDSSEETQPTATADSTAEDSMEEAEDQGEHLYSTDAPMILDPSAMSINSSGVIDAQNVIVTTSAMSSTEVATTRAITIGSQMYIIQTDPSHSGDASLDQHAFVLQPDVVSSVGSISTSQGEAISLQSAGEEGAMGDEGGFSSAESTAVVDASQVAGTFQALQGDEEGVTGVIDTAGLGSADQGETITISLEEATQIILQQQGLEGAAIQMPDGSYQLLSQQFIQVTKEDGTVDTQALPVEVMQALSAQGMVGYSSIDASHVQEGVEATQDGIDENAEAGKNSEESETHLPKGEMAEAHDNAMDHVKQEATADSGETSQRDLNLQEITQVSQGPNLTVSVTVSGSTTAILETPAQVKQEVVTPKPDLNCPIEVTERTEVMIRGKKCLLMQNPETKQLCAYPILPPAGKKRRGRPRKVRPERPDDDVRIVSDITASVSEYAEEPNAEGAEEAMESAANGAEKSGTPNTSITLGDQNSAAEGLLELSNAGPDSVRRSARKRKKAKVFDDYDVLEASSDEEGSFNDDEKDPDVTMYGVKKQKIKREAPPLPNPFMMPVKRGRGRPRRYPPPGQSTTTSSIPAVILPSANGQTLVMAPLQSLHNIQGLQSHMKTHLQQLIPKPPASSSGESPLPGGTLHPTTISITTSTPATAAITLGPDGDALPIDPSAVLDASGMLPASLPGEALPMGGESSDTQEGLDTTGEKERREGEAGNCVDGQQQTVIQIPDNLLTMFGIKKDPVKIGLKASESELEKLKCPKCDFQGYYLQQYQNHIASHNEDIQKCKCCNYLTFDKDDLLHHFKENHPRCICHICDFMAEHAYMIKRHMMRHNQEGCTCEVCGKVYKDQYILKMHVKMVHMPAEVLFECQVCGKKFTRKAHLKRHLRIHDPEKPFKCPSCEYRGCERSDISKHLLIHEEPRHVCELCGKAFRHVKNKELHVKRHNGQRDYKCGVCDFYGYTFTDIRKHIERKHSDIKTVTCEKCAMPFKSEAALREHQKENCEVMMIEQALAIATSNGGTSQATIQIPSSFAVDGQQIMIDGQQIAVDGGQVNITVEHVPEEDEDQMVETTIADIVTSSGHVIDTPDGAIHIIPNGEDIEEEEEVDLKSESIGLE
ncbi:uncharacterized protein [Littorina saxatilis]|uniref:C2H2-type domain-containing protein n=1 Tax=Littorina saxatilis TaxID=31220 RepID=A0AAN9BMF5_9CAEN